VVTTDLHCGPRWLLELHGGHRMSRMNIDGVVATTKSVVATGLLWQPSHRRQLPPIEGSSSGFNFSFSFVFVL
jgi:hypothetical protein